MDSSQKYLDTESLGFPWGRIYPILASILQNWTKSKCPVLSHQDWASGRIRDAGIRIRMREDLSHPGTRNILDQGVRNLHPDPQVQVPSPVSSSPVSSVLLHVFVVVGFYGGTPGEHEENMQTLHRNKGTSPTCCTMRDLNPRPSCCEVTVLRTESPCHCEHCLLFVSIPLWSTANTNSCYVADFIHFVVSFIDQCVGSERNNVNNSEFRILLR